MSKVESPEFAGVESNWPNLEIVNKLRGQRFIEGSPLWWSTGHTPEPREFMPFDEFMARLVHVGNARITHRFWPFAARVSTDEYGGFNDISEMEDPVEEAGDDLDGFNDSFEMEDPVEETGWDKKDIYLYPKPTVPMSILNLSVEGQMLPFLVTARPYHQREVDSEPFLDMLKVFPDIEQVSSFARAGGEISLYDHFYPHIRGLFAGRRGENFFWYPITGYRDSEIGEKSLKRALTKQGLSFFGLHHAASIYSDWGGRHYTGNWYELGEKPGLVDLKNLKWVDFGCQEVSAEELIEGYKKEDLFVRYPLYVEGFEGLWTLVIGSRTNAASKLRQPAVLGVYANNGDNGWCNRSGIARIKDRELAGYISKVISQDFGIPVDTVLFTPQKGRPKYERVQAA